MAEVRPELREAIQRDLNDLVDLVLDDAPAEKEAATGATLVVCQRFERQQREEIAFIVAEHEGQIIGELVVRWPEQPDRWGRADRENFADVERLCVRPAYRGQGVGSEMLAHAEWLCMRKDVVEIGLAVDPSAQSGIAAWFEGMGYYRTGDPYEVNDGRSERVDLIKEL